jgi:hypothetical protein
VECPNEVQGREGCCCSCLFACNSRLLLGVWCFGVWCVCLRFEDGLKQMVACHVDKRKWNVAPPGLPHGLLFVMSRFWMEWAILILAPSVIFLGIVVQCPERFLGIIRATSHMSQEP